MQDKKRDRTRDNLSRVVRGLFRRCNHICAQYNADLYILVRWRDRHFEYRSTTERSFPMTAANIVRSWKRIGHHSV